jgi:hypothetical protein
MLQTSLRRGFAGAVATVVMTLEQPLDKRLFDSKYDDVEILGKLVTRGDDWQRIGFALHVQNGAILGAAYARLKPSLRGPAVFRGLLAGLIEHVATWPMTVLVDGYHAARKELPKLAANRRAFGQATIATQCSGSSSGSSKTCSTTAAHRSRCSSVSSSLSCACRARYPRIHGSRRCARGSKRRVAPHAPRGDRSGLAPTPGRAGGRRALRARAQGRSATKRHTQPGVPPFGLRPRSGVLS